MAQKEVLYQDAIYSGYKADIGIAGVNLYDEIARWDKEILPDIHLFRPNVTTDYSLIQNKALVTINGYVHQTKLIDDKLWVMGATESMLKSKVNHIGLLSFSRNANNLLKYEILPNNISSDVGHSLYEKLFITFEQDITYPILILAGYLILPDPQFFYRVSPKTFALSIDKLNYIDKLYELYRYRDIFKNLDLTVNPNLNDIINVNEAISDSTITKFMTLNNTFLVDANVNNITQDKIYLHQSTLAGSYLYDTEPLYPVVAGMGKFVEYWKRMYDGKYILRTTDSYYNNLLFSRLPKEDVTYFNNVRDPLNTYRLSNAYMLKLTCQW